MVTWCIPHSYIRPELRAEKVCSAYALSWRQGAYALHTSDGRGFRVMYTRNTPSNHDSCNIYANLLVQRHHSFTKWCICHLYNKLCQHGVMTAISVYICTYTSSTLLLIILMHACVGLDECKSTTVPVHTARSIKPAFANSAVTTFSAQIINHV